MSSTPSADESAIILTNKLKAREPFVFTKFGDGTLWWMSGKPVQSANGEVYRPGIDQELRKAADVLSGLPHAYFGDQLTCSSGPYLEAEQERYIHAWDKCAWLHFETFLLHRLTPELLEFYRVLKADTRPKVLVCGKHLLPATRMLGCYACIIVDSSNAHREALHQLPSSEIVLTACGHASKILVAAEASAYKSKTFIELGSALDPLFVGRTRSEQIEPGLAREYFKGLL